MESVLAEDKAFFTERAIEKSQEAIRLGDGHHKFDLYGGMYTISVDVVKGSAAWAVVQWGDDGEWQPVAAGTFGG